MRSGALKPDITAPGVNITAARSQQMTTGTGAYRSISGTSMATPHVSGAAAILAQRHPDWSGRQLKEALMSSAKGLAAGYTPYQVGTGRVDVAAAVRGGVRASGPVFFGNFDWPHEPTDAPVTRQVTFTNPGATDVTLNLATTGTGPFSAGAASVTVPAGGQASVPVTGDPTKGGGGQFTGYLVGTDAATGAAVTRTSLGLIKEDERYDLKVKLLGRDGRPATSTVVVKKAGDPDPYYYTVTGEQTLRMPPGTYTVESFLDVPGERADSLGFAVLVDPETVLKDSGATVVLDASKARLLDTTTPRRSQDRQRRIDYTVGYAGGDSFRDAFQIPVKYDDLYLSPTEQVTESSFTMVNRWRRGEPLLSLDALGLRPVEATVQPGSTLTARPGPPDHRVRGQRRGLGLRRARREGQGRGGDPQRRGQRTGPYRRRRGRSARSCCLSSTTAPACSTSRSARRRSRSPPCTATPARNWSPWPGPAGGTSSPTRCRTPPTSTT
nr:hypothetical protein GCM10020092_067710 [Actinoplanes digitatis]